MTAQVIPIAQGGRGSYTWDKAGTITNTYRIRRGHKVVARLVLDDTLPFHSAVVDEVCAALDRIEREVT